MLLCLLRSQAVWDSAAADQKHVIGTKSLRYRTHLVTPDSPFMVDGYSDTSEDRDFDLPHIIGEMYRARYKLFGFLPWWYVSIAHGESTVPAAGSADATTLTCSLQTC